MYTDVVSFQSMVSEETLSELICDLVSIPSYPGIPGQESGVAEYIHSYFSTAGIDAELVAIVDGRTNIYAKLHGKGKGRTLVLNGHTDTVPPYDMIDALLPRKEGREIIGRGASDMKGPLACMMLAMRLIKEADIQLAGDLVFTGVIDEELTSLGTRAFLRSGLKADGAIVGEPTNLEVCIGHKGLQWFQFDIHGKAVHGGEQDRGVNAIRSASLLIQRIEKELIPKITSRKHPLIGASSLNYGLIKGGFQPSTVPGECVFQIDRRWIPGEDYDDVEHELLVLVESLKREDPSFETDFRVMDKSIMETGIIHEGFVIDPEHPLVKEAQRAVLDYNGHEAVTGPFKAWTDGGLLSRYGGIPTIVFGPGNLSTAHTKHECINIDQALRSVLIYISIILGFCGVVES